MHCHSCFSIQPGNTNRMESGKMVWASYLINHCDEWLQRWWTMYNEWCGAYTSTIKYTRALFSLPCSCWKTPHGYPLGLLVCGRIPTYLPVCGWIATYLPVYGQITTYLPDCGYTAKKALFDVNQGDSVSVFETSLQGTLFWLLP